MEKEIQLLKELIATPSFSSEEDKTALLLEKYFKNHKIEYYRYKNNVWAKNKYFDTQKPTILLNSHHDTVRPNKSYTFDPFKPFVKEGKLFGLGSNDAGASVVALLAAFRRFYDKENLKYNLLIAITGEEETSGANGLVGLLKQLPGIDFAIVGEPTGMNLAIAEKGLLVLHAETKGIPGHAAHKNTVNPIYLALDDLMWFRDFKFPKSSEFLGEVKMSVSMINAGTQHNVIPAVCSYVVDIRVNDQYTNEEILSVVKENVKSKIDIEIDLPSSSINKEHPVVKAGIALGRTIYGSPTLSDQSVLTCPSVKLGPGNSTRSHQADEFVCLDEIKEGIRLYINILEMLV